MQRKGQYGPECSAGGGDEEGEKGGQEAAITGRKSDSRAQYRTVRPIDPVSSVGRHLKLRCRKRGQAIYSKYPTRYNGDFKWALALNRTMSITDD